MTFEPHTYCSFCGARFPDGLGWPRACPNCGNTSYRNPLPVAVVLVPVDASLLVVRRAVAPQVGKLALPGGYINLGESWQAAGAREVCEETGVVIDPATIRAFQVHSAPDGTVLIFGIVGPLSGAALPMFAPNAEVSERTLIATPLELAFPLHTSVAADFFAQRPNTLR